MQPDLLERARSAVTPEQECNVIDDALQILSRGKLNEIHALYDLIDNARVGRLPRPVLLGVVAALKPEHLSLAVCSFSADHGCAIAKAGPKDAPARAIEWVRHERDYMAALIAILEAGKP